MIEVVTNFKIPRLRDQAHMDRVAGLGFCAIPTCRYHFGRQPLALVYEIIIDPHHLTFAQPKAKNLRVGDQFTINLCRWTHHSQTSKDGVHAFLGPEIEWWIAHGIDDPLSIAASLFAETLDLRRRK
jgi:hypothetical protein